MAAAACAPLEPWRALQALFGSASRAARLGRPDDYVQQRRRLWLPRRLPDVTDQIGPTGRATNSSMAAASSGRAKRKPVRADSPGRAGALAGSMSRCPRRRLSSRAPRDLDDGAHHTRASGWIVKRCDERPVDLDVRDGELLEVRERRVAVPKSSMAIATPRARRACSRSRTAAVFCRSRLSVSSSVIQVGDAPACAIAACTVHGAGGRQPAGPTGLSIFEAPDRAPGQPSERPPRTPYAAPRSRFRRSARSPRQVG